MVNGCCVKSCKNDWKPNQNISYHTFPKNLELRLKWLESLGKTGYSRHWRVCSAHFKIEDYIKTYVGGNLRLKPGAIPSQNLDNYKLPITSIKNNIPLNRAADVIEKNNSQYQQGTWEIRNQQNMDIEDIEYENNEYLDDSDFSDSVPEPWDGDDIDIQELEVATSSMLKIEHDYCRNSDEESSVILKSQKLKRKFDQIDSNGTDDSKIMATIREAAATDTIVKQKFEIEALQTKINSLEFTIGRLQDAIEDLRKKNLLSGLADDNITTLDNSGSMILSRIINGDQSVNRYPSALKNFVSTLYFLSPQAYDYVRNHFIFCLPSSHTVRSWYRNDENNADTILGA